MEIMKSKRANLYPGTGIVSLNGFGIFTLAIFLAAITLIVKLNWKRIIRRLKHGNN